MRSMTRLHHIATIALLAVCVLTASGCGGAVKDFAVSTKDFAVFMLTPNLGRTPEEREMRHNTRAENCLDGEWMKDPDHPGEWKYRCHLSIWKLKRALQ